MEGIKQTEGTKLDTYFTTELVEQGEERVLLAHRATGCQLIDCEGLQYNERPRLAEILAILEARGLPIGEIDTMQNGGNGKFFMYPKKGIPLVPNGPLEINGKTVQIKTAPPIKRVVEAKMTEIHVSGLPQEVPTEEIFVKMEKKFNVKPLKQRQATIWGFPSVKSGVRIISVPIEQAEKIPAFFYVMGFLLRTWYKGCLNHRTCSRCGQKGHLPKDCPSPATSQRIMSYAEKAASNDVTKFPTGINDQENTYNIEASEAHIEGPETIPKEGLDLEWENFNSKEIFTPVKARKNKKNKGKNIKNGKKTKPQEKKTYTELNPYFLLQEPSFDEDFPPLSNGKEMEMENSELIGEGGEGNGPITSTPIPNQKRKRANNTSTSGGENESNEQSEQNTPMNSTQDMVIPRQRITIEQYRAKKKLNTGDNLEEEQLNTSTNTQENDNEQEIETTTEPEQTLNEIIEESENNPNVTALHGREENAEETE